MRSFGGQMLCVAEVLTWACSREGDEALLVGSTGMAVDGSGQGRHSAGRCNGWPSVQLETSSRVLAHVPAPLMQGEGLRTDRAV